jgi:hydroxyacylglutathione hydrolase
MRVVPVPCLKDNYAYLVIDETTDGAAVVDPGEAAPVEAALVREGVTLGAIWATHHHHDHVGGVADLVATRPGLEVVVGTNDAGKVPQATKIVDDGDRVSLDGLHAVIIHNPGHTLGAISFLVDGCVFTGDTLFCGGCGRVFEGTPEMMVASLDKLAALPPTTRVYCGHEYTAANLKFATAVEPESAPVTARLAALTTPSVPSTIAEERATNPFLRSAMPAVVAAAGARGAAGDPVSVFAAIRAWKNDFR